PPERLLERCLWCAADPWLPRRPPPAHRPAQGVDADGPGRVEPFPRLLSLLSFCDPARPADVLLRARHGSPVLGGEDLPRHPGFAHHPGHDRRAAGAVCELPGIARPYRQACSDGSLAAACVAVRVVYRRGRLLDAVSPLSVA